MTKTTRQVQTGKFTKDEVWGICFGVRIIHIGSGGFNTVNVIDGHGDGSTPDGLAVQFDQVQFTVSNLSVLHLQPARWGSVFGNLCCR